jgi:choline dehydrogenase-like flavoprotein
MAITRMEGKLRLLTCLWLLLFGGGFIVLAVSFWLPVGAQLHLDNPLVAFTWMGQALLFLCSFYLLSGIRDNDLTAGVISCYKFISGTATMLFLLGYAHNIAYILFVVIVGGLLDYVMGGVTFVLWLAARRSRALRMPLALDVEPGISEEPAGRAARAQRISIIVSGIVFAVAMVALIIVIGFSSLIPHNVTFYEVAAGNAVAVYGTLAILSMLAAEAPQRRSYTLDILLCICYLIGIVLLFWAMHLSLTTILGVILLIWGIAHLVIAVVNTVLRVQAARSERPARFLGAWLHRVFETFAEVIITGGVEDITPRQVADAADAWLADIPSRRVSSLKWDLIFVEIGALLFFRVPASRMGRLERTSYLTNILARGQLFFHDLVRVKQLIFFIYYSDERTYQEVGFTKFEQREKYWQAQQAHKLPTEPVVYPPKVNVRHLSVDVCVIGSGAGGAVVAANLAEAGKSVVILEEGPYLKRDRIDHDERTMAVKAYREGGLQLTRDLEMYLLQGRCVGGSTFSSNGICIDLPPEVLVEWEKLGATLNREKLKESLACVRDTIQPVRLADKLPLVERGSLKFVEGCQKLGLPVGWFEANLGDCLGCGYCMTGCSYEKKMSVDISYIPRALKAGAILVSDCKAHRIATYGARAQAVEAMRNDGTPLLVEAQQIVVACGSIGSSLLLLRSGITRNVGTRLSLNVRSLVFAEFSEPIDSFDGIQVGAYHARPRYTLESFAMPPGAFAASLPGMFRDHFDTMHSYRNFTITSLLTSTQPVGQVSLVGDGRSPLSFSLPITDLRKVKDGIKQACRIQLAAGAKRVLPATFTPCAFFNADQLDALDELIVETDDVSLGSAHLQGGNPMSDDQEIGAVDMQFRVYGYENLFVCDASVFPTSVQVEPQLSVMGLADYASRLIVHS